jgi:hypothetical protein
MILGLKGFKYAALFHLLIQLMHGPILLLFSHQKGNPFVTTYFGGQYK